MTSFLFLLNLIFVALIVAIGFVGGWCAHWYEAHRQMRRTEGDRRLAREVLADLHTLINNVSADVDEHSDCCRRKSSRTGRCWPPIFSDGTTRLIPPTSMPM